MSCPSSWVLYITLVVFGALSPIYVFALPSSPMQAGRRWADKVKELDWLGVVLSAGMYVCSVLVFTFGGAEWACAPRLRRRGHDDGRGRDVAAAHVYVFSILLGLGQTLTQASYGVSMAPVEPARMPESIQSINAAQGQSMLISLVVASAVFQDVALNGMAKALAGLGYTATQIKGAVAGADSELLQELSPAKERKAIGAIMETHRRGMDSDQCGGRAASCVFSLDEQEKATSAGALMFEESHTAKKKQVPRWAARQCAVPDRRVRVKVKGQVKFQI